MNCSLKDCIYRFIQALSDAHSSAPTTSNARLTASIESATSFFPTFKILPDKCQLILNLMSFFEWRLTLKDID